MSVPKQAQLRQRALQFIHRAALSDLDVVVSNALEALVEIDPQGGARHFRTALNSRYPIVRSAGCLALGDTRNCTASQRVVQCLSDEHPQVRLAAAYAAYRCGDRNAGRILADALRDSEDERERATAAMLIGRLGEPEAKGRLRLAADDKSNAVAIQAVAAMALLGDEASIDRLIQFAQGEAVMRIIALQTMVELGNPKVAEALLYRLNYPDEYLQNRLIAARALGRIGRRDGYKLAFDSLDFAADGAAGNLGPAEKAEETARVRALAALALGDIGDPAALPRLERLASESDDPRVQLAASTAICRIIPSPFETSREPRPTRP